MSSLVRDIAVWLCALAVLAVVTLATSGALEIVLTLAAVFAWVFSLGRPMRGRAAPLLVVVLPAVVALVIADAVSSDEWFAFAAVAIAFPMMVVWRELYGRWQDRRAPHGAA
jgi:hypothetical protein